MNFKNTFKHFLGIPAQLIPIKAWAKLTGQNLFLPFYHSIGNVEDLPHIRHLYRPRTAKEFERDLEFLLKNFEPVEISDLRNSAKKMSRLKSRLFIFLLMTD